MTASSSPRLALSKRRQLAGRRRLRVKPKVRRSRPKPMSAAKRKENRLVRQVFAEIEPRDGRCVIQRLDYESQLLAGPCSGPSDPMHLGEWRRAKTRRMAPEVRHTRQTILRGCRGHHRAYDGHDFDLAYERDKGAEGVLLVVRYVKGTTHYIAA
jgi:hypothetical protein